MISASTPLVCSLQSSIYDQSALPILGAKPFQEIDRFAADNIWNDDKKIWDFILGFVHSFATTNILSWQSLSFGAGGRRSLILAVCVLLPAAHAAGQGDFPIFWQTAACLPCQPDSRIGMGLHPLHRRVSSKDFPLFSLLKGIVHNFLSIVQISYFG